MTRAANDSPPERRLESLRSPVRFREVMRRGRRTTVGGLTVVSLAHSEPSVRVGLVAGRKLGRAVARNRIKRRLRHACRQVEFGPGRDYVLIPRPEVGRVPFATLVDWLRRAVSAT